MCSSVLVALLFLLVCSHAVIIQFFVPDQNARNGIALVCIANGIEQPRATFQFFSGLDESTLQLDIFSESDRLEVIVEHTSEQFIRCVFNGEMSNFLAVAALPVITDFDPAIVNVSQGEEATLMCPFVLGNLHENFDPYEITWIKQEFGQLPETLNMTDPDGSFQISPDGRILRLPMSDPMNTATYRCKLMLSRCTFFDENNDVSDRCELEPPFMGPITSLYVLGNSQVMIRFDIPDPNSRNDIAMKCIAEGRPQAGATYQFFSDLNESTLQKTTISESDSLEYTVEHTSEQFIRCVFNGEMSDFLAIAALPDITNSNPAIVNVLRGEEKNITCPFMLGKLHEYFDPYEITWTRIGGQSTVTLTEPDESFQLSEDGRKLCLFPMDTSIYQCRLRLSRCTSFNESNDISGRCELESPLLGPAISLNVLEPDETVPTSHTDSTAAVTSSTEEDAGTSSTVIGVITAVSLIIIIINVIITCVVISYARHMQKKVDLIVAPNQRYRIMERNNSDHSIEIPERIRETPFTNNQVANVNNEENLPHEVNREANADPEVNREVDVDPEPSRETSTELEANRETNVSCSEELPQASNKETNVPPGKNIKANVPMEENTAAKVSQNLYPDNADKYSYVVKNMAYSLNQNSYPNLKGATNFGTTERESSCHSRNLALNKGLASNTSFDTTLAENLIATPRGEVSLACSDHETATDGGLIPTPSDRPHLAERELVPLEANNCNLTLSSIDMPNSNSKASLTTINDDTTSVTSVQSDGEHSHNISHLLEAATMYDPAPISLQEFNSPFSDLLGVFDFGQAGTGMPLTSMEEERLIFNEMH